MKKITSILFVLCSTLIVFGESNIDLLKAKMQKEYNPQKRFAILTELSDAYIEMNETTALYYAFEALKMANALEDESKIGKVYQSISHIQFLSEEYQNALNSADSAIKYFEKTENKKQLGETYLHKETIYDQISEYPNSLMMAHKALMYFEEIQDTIGIAMCYNDIGVVHYYNAEYESSLNYTNKSFKLYELINDTSGMSSCYNNLANIFWELNEEEKSLEFYLKGYDLDVLVGDLEGQAASLCNIGEVYVLLDDFDKAEEVLLEAYQITYEINDDLTMIYALRGLANMYSLSGKHSKALINAKKSVELAFQIGALSEQSESFLVLSDVYKRSSDYSEALLYFQKYHDIEDSIFNEENAATIYEMETKFRTDKISTENELLKKQGELTELKVFEEEQRNYYLNIGIILVLIVSIITLWSLFTKQKANKKLKLHRQLIEDRNDELKTAFHQIEEKNKEITASISYAKRIQYAILPDSHAVKSTLDDSFILYKPKDIVAGDFYWIERVGENVLFAAADCTGHGVPGAMVSVVCNNALNRAVREFKLTQPSDILDKVSELVVEQFEKSETGKTSFLEETIKDGMDIALCSLGPINNSKEGVYRKLWFAGANNPLWIIRNNKVLITAPSKQPVGKYDNRKPFEDNYVELYKEDSLYLFSDGFIDQFGGPKGKKFKSKAFKELLLSVQNLSMPKQKEFMNDAFESWRGDLEQIDDVCVIGVRV